MNANQKQNSGFFVIYTNNKSPAVIRMTDAIEIVSLAHHLLSKKGNDFEPPKLDYVSFEEDGSMNFHGDITESDLIDFSIKTLKRTDKHFRVYSDSEKGRSEFIFEAGSYGLGMEALNLLNKEAQ